MQQIKKCPKCGVLGLKGRMASIDAVRYFAWTHGLMLGTTIGVPVGFMLSWVF